MPASRWKETASLLSDTRSSIRSGPFTSRKVNGSRSEPADEQCRNFVLPPNRALSRRFCPPIDAGRVMVLSDGKPFCLSTRRWKTAALGCWKGATHASFDAASRLRHGSLRNGIHSSVRSMMANQGSPFRWFAATSLARYGAASATPVDGVESAAADVTYYFVFGVVLQSRFPGDNSRSGFVLYFLAGMLPWLAFSEAAGRAPHVLIEHRNFIKKLVFPVEVLPVTQVFSALVTELLRWSFLVGLPLCARYRSRDGALAAGPADSASAVHSRRGLVSAALGVFVATSGGWMGFLLTLWFFLTPSVIPERRSLPGEARPF